MRLMLLVGLGLLAGCVTSITSPVAVIADRGDILTGTATSTLQGGSYHVTNGPLSCSGSYDTRPALAVSFTITCNDGRRGFGQAIRDGQGIGGQGSLRMDDGETASFLFGPAAATFSSKVRAQTTQPAAPPPTRPPASRLPRT